ncbi:EH domain-containing protein [Thiohalobacter thiocyanaticus]|uniref:EF-hand domain-containing protein n=1 Tax=Thiohalobacter thiocyanaticus TaxID=585455 RepID=A0A426QIC7_9GAMM|nr:EF-hand domain-containing protein [Thiohalobacter thiocyanaticus]RRQ21498.1 EF-hand domain-containing protein [Thiohalobacter thiocyanaticus]
MKKQIAVIACVSAFAAGSAIAGEQQDELFKMLDTNQDGYISAEEAQAHGDLTSQWNSVDQNSDGQIDQSEFSAFEIESDSESGM